MLLLHELAGIHRGFVGPRTGQDELKGAECVCPMQYWRYTYILKLLVGNQRFRFKWAVCILSGNPK